METTTLLANLRETYHQLQSLAPSSVLQRVIDHYSTHIDQPLIVDLYAIYAAMLEETPGELRSRNLGIRKRSPVYAPVSEEVLLAFCRRFKRMLLPPTHADDSMSPLVLPASTSTLPLLSLDECINVYFWNKPVSLNERVAA